MLYGIHLTLDIGHQPFQLVNDLPGPEGIKLFSCSTQLSMKFKLLIRIKISRNSAFLGSYKPRLLFFLLINVKIPTIVGILTFMSRKNHAQLS